MLKSSQRAYYITVRIESKSARGHLPISTHRPPLLADNKHKTGAAQHRFSVFSKNFEKRQLVMRLSLSFLIMISTIKIVRIRQKKMSVGILILGKENGEFSVPSRALNMRAPPQGGVFMFSAFHFA